MPYKDPAKKKQWERENRTTKTRHIWWGYLYHDSAPEDWERRIRESGYECVWATHDKDVTATGEIKKSHTHVAVKFEQKVTQKTAEEVLGACGVVPASVQFRDSWRAVCRYMIHMDDPDKYQYDPQIVNQCGGADWESAIHRSSDKYRLVGEMMAWIDDPKNNLTNGCPPQFADLMRYARDERQEWFHALCDSCAVVMREYCKGRRHNWRDEVLRR